MGVARVLDAASTAAVGEQAEARYTPDDLADALRRPGYTPTLLRRACPPTRPLLHGVIDAADAIAALRQASGSGSGSLNYSESVHSDQPLRLRDVPLHGHKRQFGARQDGIGPAKALGCGLRLVRLIGQAAGSPVFIPEPHHAHPHRRRTPARTQQVAR